MRSQITTVKLDHQGTESRFARYNETHRDKRRTYEQTVRRSRRNVDRDRMQKKRGTARRFMAWDGEGSSVPNGEPQPYMLFGNSDGKYIVAPQLRTKACLDLILSSPKDCIHFGFAFNYDVNQIFVDLSIAHLSRLAKTNKCRWKPNRKLPTSPGNPVYHLEYIQNKWFKVSCDGVTRTIYDVFHFFNKSLGSTLEEFRIGPWQQISQSNVLSVVQQLGSDLTLAQKTMHLATQLHKWQPNAPTTTVKSGLSGLKSGDVISANEAISVLSEVEIVALFKEERAHFTWEELPLIKKYMFTELKYMVQLMDHMRELFNQAGFFPTSWHGPGALARTMLKNHGIKDCKLDTLNLYPLILDASRYAFSGGRFEQWLGGLYKGGIYNYDIHSAYPYAIQFLPNLATGKWYTNKDVDRSKIRAERFCIYHIRYDAHKLEKSVRSYHYKQRPRPLFRRLKDGGIAWPDQVEGWYWSPEAELVKDDPAAEFIEAYEYVDDGTRPLAFIAEIYKNREYHKALGNAIEYAFKLAMNSCYGQFAQRVGQDADKKPPAFHQLEWAGYITSMCKAMVHKVATYAYDQGGLITADTDGIFASVQIPDHILPNGIGDGLGQWEEKKYQGMLIYANGFYWLEKDGEWGTCRSRGAPRGKVPIEAAWEALETLAPIKYNRTEFIGFKTALHGMGLSRKWRSWTTSEVQFEFGGGKGSKRRHIGNPVDGKNAGRCQRCLPDARIGKWTHQMHNLTAANASFGEYRGRYTDLWSHKHPLPWLETDEKTADVLEDEALMKIYEDLTL